MQMLKKERSSNIELFRIITMIIIVAHHYVVNSNLINIIEAKIYLNAQDIFILLFGWGGKTGINCFVLITGYFMCTSDITVKKYCKLIGEYYFYTIVIYLERIIGRNGLVYFEVADSNKILALITSVCLFMLFKNLNIKQNKVINNVAASTFGVLLIHANSDTMRKFLWYNVFDGTKYYGTAILYVHAILSVIIIFAICILIDILRRMTLEKVFLEKIDKIKFSK